MITVFDSLTATLISGAVILMLFSMHKRVSRVAVEQTGMYAAKTQAIEFGKWMQRDLSRAGDGNCAGATISDPTYGQEEVGGQTHRWTRSFGFSYCDESKEVIRVTYDVERYEASGVEQSVKVRRGASVLEVPILQLSRTVEKGGVSSDQGESPPLLTSFKIDILDADSLGGSGGSSSKPSYDSFIRVQFSTTRPYKAVTEEYFQEVNWMTSVPVQ